MKPESILTNLAFGVKVVAANIPQATPLAERLPAAHVLTQPDQQSMIFIEERRISGQMSHEKGLIGTIATAIWCQTEAVDNPTGIGINNKDWLICRVKQNRIGGLLANAPDRKKLLAKLGSTEGKQPTQVIPAVFAEEVSQSLELARLNIVVNAGADEDR